jgi:hypothetical protein
MGSSISSSLKKASTSAELKSAVDSLPRDGKCYKKELRDLIISKKNLIVDAATADSVVNFLEWYNVFESSLGLLPTKEFQDLIINHIAPHVAAIREFGRFMCIIVHDQQSAELFANVESFSAILKCFHRSKTSADVMCIVISFNNILHYNPSSNKLLNSLPVVDAFSFIIPLTSDDRVVRYISDALLRILDNNEEARKKFRTAEFFKILQGMEKYATTDDSKTSFRNALGLIDPSDYSKPLADATTSSQLKSAVDSLPQKTRYYTEQVRDALIAKKHLIDDAETADSVVKFLRSFSSEDSRRPLLRTKEVQELIINHIAPHVTAIKEIGSLIFNTIYDSNFAADLFSNVESFSAILKCCHRSRTSWDAERIATCILCILENNPPSYELLNSLPVVDAFSFIIPLADDHESIKWISRALSKIIQKNVQVQHKFATTEFLEIFQKMEKYATTDESKTSFTYVFETLNPLVTDFL